MIDIKTWLQSQQQNTKLKRFDLELLLLGALKTERSWLFSHDDSILSDQQLKQLSRWVEEAKQGKPIAYILGHKAFWTLDLMVNEHTLIPRPETEQIIELALTLPKTPKNILDLGTGTGAIALSLAKEFSDASVMATDFSSDALNVAAMNAKNHHINNVTFKQSDWFTSLDITTTFDLIVSNPPYIVPNDQHLADLTFEPISALVAENNGLKDLQTIINQAPDFLNPEAFLMLEHGYDQGTAVRNLLAEQGFQNIKTHQDLAGHDRISVGQKASS